MGDRVSLEDAIRTISERVKTQADAMVTEEAVKTAVVLPFLNALGYDVFNPKEVIPEFTADAVGKKGEKVDYAINIEGEVRILIECKPIQAELVKQHLAQLFRYFTVTTAKFAILTNGRYFHFHTDIEEPNKLDHRPFLVFDLAEPQQSLLPELQKFARRDFSVEGILDSASRLKYKALIKHAINEQIESPTEEFVRVICSTLHEGAFTRTIREKYTPLVRDAFREMLRDAVQSKLSSALAHSALDGAPAQSANVPEEEVVTTEEELEAFMIVKSIVRDVVKAGRIFIRDQKSYCSVLLDDNNRKTITRLHFNGRFKAISLFDAEREEKVRIENLDNIFDHSERLRSAVRRYLEGKSLSAPVAAVTAPATELGASE